MKLAAAASVLMEATDSRAISSKRKQTQGSHDAAKMAMALRAGADAVTPLSILQDGSANLHAAAAAGDFFLSPPSGAADGTASMRSGKSKKKHHRGTSSMRSHRRAQTQGQIPSFPPSSGGGQHSRGVGSVGGSRAGGGGGSSGDFFLTAQRAIQESQEQEAREGDMMSVQEIE